jgi:hypothetical protein
MPTICSAVDLELAHYQSALSSMYTALHGYPDAKNCATTNISAASQRDEEYVCCMRNSFQSHFSHTWSGSRYNSAGCLIDITSSHSRHILPHRLHNHKGTCALVEERHWFSFWAARYQPRSALPGSQGISFLAKPSKPWVTQSRLGASIRA